MSLRCNHSISAHVIVLSQCNRVKPWQLYVMSYFLLSHILIQPHASLECTSAQSSTTINTFQISCNTNICATLGHLCIESLCPWHSKRTGSRICSHRLVYQQWIVLKITSHRLPDSSTFAYSWNICSRTGNQIQCAFLITLICDFESFSIYFVLLRARYF